ncbi:hypothetical protein E2C01_084044 [Portunus trituberculatus]|uniref:Uncharacterized protein n=1 Tax=Portunus trituberculatus TaxID=210409 RepID=A0A5B7IU88_PORTR|nr:hypothetical protein [Portunus trituberculatus]
MKQTEAKKTHFTVHFSITQPRLALSQAAAHELSHACQAEQRCASTLSSYPENTRGIAGTDQCYTRQDLTFCYIYETFSMMCFYVLCK